MTFGEQGGAGAPVEECARMIDTYSDAGGNVIDTAVNYRDGASEEILGQLLLGRRDRFVLATKYTLSRDGTDPNAAGGRVPGEHPCRASRMELVCRVTGALQPAPARYRTRGGSTSSATTSAPRRSRCQLR